MVKIALLQMTCSPEPAKNLQKVVTQIETAANQGAQIVCLQELFRTRYFCQVEEKRFLQYAEPIPGPTTELFSPLTRKLGVAIVASIFEVAGGATGGPPSSAWTERSEGSRRMGVRSDRTRHYYNTALAIDADGKILGKYRKAHIPDDLKNYYGESFYFKQGDLGYPVFKTRYATIGLQVCYDQWFPEGARALAQAGAQIIFYPTSIGFSYPLPPAGEGGRRPGEGEHDAWLTVQRGHAISNGVFVAACNRVGLEDHINFWGTSFVCDPMGKVLVKASADKEETLLVECDLSRIEEVKRDWPFLKEC